MADQNSPRSYRTRDPRYQHGGEEGSGESDPLAELARLIGQTDPFADRGRQRDPGDRPDHPDDSRLADAGELHGDSDAYPHGQPWQPEAASDPHLFADPADEQYAGHADGERAQGYDSDYEAYYDADQQALDEAAYQEELTRKRRRWRLVAVAAIACLGVFGAAGAYGYRNYVGHHRSSGAPPVIMADAGPTKVIPVARTTDNGTGAKLSYDRVGGDRTEKIVSREEKPVDVNAAAVTPPRQIYSAPQQSGSPEPLPATIPVAGEPAAGTPTVPAMSSVSTIPNGSGVLLPSPHRVKTLTIRPDMTVVRDSSPMQEASPQAVQPAPTAQPREAPEPAPRPTASRHEPTPPAPRVEPPRPARHAMAPLSLSPDAAPRPANESRNPARGEIALASASPTAAIPTAPAGGGYAVQISSQRSEADAKASLRALQAKYPGVLGGRQSFIRRADLGSKGVYYRTLVGPFASAEQAAKFCSSLKAAGGQCLIHRN